MKLNKLFYLLGAVSTIFVACNNDKTTGGNETVKGYLVVEEKSVSVEFYGGDTIINYYITEAPEGAVPTVTTSVDWIKDFVAANDEIHFNAELNESTESRVASINVKYGKQSYEVFVRQDAGWEVDVEFTAGALNGEHYGVNGYGMTNYFAILSQNGTTGIIDLYLDTYYRLDMFHTTPAGDPLTLPQGVYEFDYNGVGDTISFGGYYSLMFKPHEDGGYTEQHFSNGVVIVSENKIEAFFVLLNGEVHHVVYEGSLELGWLQFETPDFYSTLENDYSFSHSRGTIRLGNYGDYYNLNANNWVVSMVLPGDPLNGDFFRLDIVTDDLDTTRDSIVGTYTCVADENSFAHNRFLAGTMSGMNYLGSWYQVLVNNLVDHSRVAPITGGTITIAEEGTGFLVTYDCTDDNGHKITGTFSCPTVEEYNPQ